MPGKVRRNTFTNRMVVEVWGRSVGVGQLIRHHVEPTQVNGFGPRSTIAQRIAYRTTTSQVNSSTNDI